MKQVIEGYLSAEGKKIAAVVGRFNELIGQKLLGGAYDCFIRHHGHADNFTTVWVPGAFEIPLAAKSLALTKKFDAIVCLGAVIRGATPHFDLVASEVAKGIAQVSMESGIPVTFGVLTTETLEQAFERAGSKAGNKGWESALAAIEMADLLRKIQG